MDDGTAKQAATAWVVHSNRLVASDICDILKSVGLQDVAAKRSVEDLPDGPMLVAIVECSLSDLQRTSKFKKWCDSGVPIIVLNGHSGLPKEYLNMRMVHQPFRTQDITAALQSLDLFAR